MRIIIEGDENDRETAEVLQRIAAAIVKDTPATPPPGLLEAGARLGATSAGPAAIESSSDLVAKSQPLGILDNISTELVMDAGAAAPKLASSRTKPRATGKKRVKRTAKRAKR